MYQLTCSVSLNLQLIILAYNFWGSIKKVFYIYMGFFVKADKHNNLKNVFYYKTTIFNISLYITPTISTKGLVSGSKDFWADIWLISTEQLK